MSNLPDDISVHVFKGVKLMGIYDKNDILDKDMARERNKDIELKIEKLREILSYNIIKLKPERVEKIEEEIENLLEERDDNTFKYGLAGKEFERLYLKKNGTSSDGADRDGDGLITFSNGLRITRMGSEFDKFLMDSTIIQEANGDIRSVVSQKGSKFENITSEMFELYSKKNADYGDAFTQSLDEDGLLVSKIRLKDKLNRFAKLIENDALVNDESMRDTLIDMANYAAMTIMWLDENE